VHLVGFTIAIIPYSSPNIIMVTKRRGWTRHAARFEEIITAGSFRI
jgi:hypothetical protein